MSAPAWPWMSSVVATRTYAIFVGFVLRRSAPVVPLVRPGFVLAGLHWISPAELLFGISAWATFELNGPTTAKTLVSPISVWMLVAPWFGLWTPFTASSCLLTVTV